jgi:uncharacterized protein YegJ (DUF2314 family)
MKSFPVASRLSLTLVAVIAALLVGCSKPSEITSVSANDAEMNAAIARARETLPHFWKVFEKPERDESFFSLKVRITDGNGVEHFWTQDIERRDGKIFATIINEPEIVKNVKFKERIEVPEADISDWLYKREGKMIGNFTIKPLFKSMPPEEVARYKGIMADP